MRFRELLLLLAALTTLAGLATAADEPGSSKSQEAFVIPMLRRHPAQKWQFFSPKKHSGLVGRPSDKPTENPSYNWSVAPLVHGTPQALTNRDLCYTMRTYMVRPSERLRDNESGLRDYSTCQKASIYQFRAAGQEKKDAKLK